MKTIILTREHIFQGQSRYGGWNKTQLEILGIRWPPRHGWINRAVGTRISETDFNLFILLRGMKPKVQKRVLGGQTEFDALTQEAI